MKMERRLVLAWIAGAPLLATRHANAVSHVRMIGVLSLGEVPPPEIIRDFWAPLRGLGWTEGQNLIVDRRYTTDASSLNALARALVESRVEILVTVGTDATLAAMGATKQIPILMAGAGDAKRLGLIGDLRRPGGNVTGFSFRGPEADRKIIALTKETLSKANKIGLVMSSQTAYFKALVDELTQAALSLGIQPTVIDADLAKGPNLVPHLTRHGVQAVVLFSPGVQWSDSDANSFMRAVLEAKLPAIVSERRWLLQGGLLSFELDEAERRRVFTYLLDRLLRGTKPADLPVQEATRFVVRVNMKTARALNIALPATVLQRADEVIE